MAAATWGIQVLAARELGSAQYAQFMLIWAAFFTVTGTLQGLQQEATRAVSVSTAATAQVTRGPLVGTAIVGLVGAMAVLVAGVPLAERFRLTDRWAIAYVLAFGFVAYAFANLIMGALAAHNQWSLVAWAIGLEGAIRATLLVVGLHLGVRELGWMLGMTGAVGAWLLLASMRPVRKALLVKCTTNTASFVGNSAQAMLAACCGALLVSGFPLLLATFGPGDVSAETGVVLAVLLITRAPLLVLMNASQGFVIGRLVGVDNPLGEIGRWAVRAAPLLAIAIGVAATGGPFAIRAVLGEGFQASGWLVAGLTLAAVSLAGLTLTGWAALATSRHSLFVGGWLIATAATAGLLMLPGTVSQRSVLALTLGPLAGIVIHSRSMRRSPVDP